MSGPPPRAAMSRRSSAPAVALRPIRTRSGRRWAPKITPSAAAPIPANAAKRSVEAGLSRATALSAALAPETSSLPAEACSTTFSVFMTLFISTPTGAPPTGMIFCAFGSSNRATRITISPQCGKSSAE